MLDTLIRSKTLSLSLLATALLGISIWSIFRIPLEIMPKEGVPPFLLVRVNIPGDIDPETTEILHAIPIEGALKKVSFVQSMTTSIDSGGVSSSLSFIPRTNLDMVSLQILESLSELESNNLIDLSKVTISRVNPESLAVLKVGLDLSAIPSQEIKKIKEDLKTNLEATDGVGRIEIIGIDPPSLIAQTFLKNLEIAQTTASSLLAPFRTNRTKERIGVVRDVSGETSTFVETNPMDIGQISKMPIRQDSTHRISDMFNFRLVEKSDEEINRLNAKNSFFVEVFPKDGVNLLSTVPKITDKIAAWAKNFNSNLNVQVVFDQSKGLKLAIQDVIDSLLQAMAITFVVVFLFYRNITRTLLTNVTIPISLTITVLILYLSGDSLNILTLSGLILGIGMVVDNAALFLDQYDEHRKSENALTAAGKSAQEVALPLVLSSVTNALIFVPLAFIDGGDSFISLMKGFQIPIVGSLIGSLLAALLFLPLLRIQIRTQEKTSTSENSKVQYIFERLYLWRIVSLVSMVTLFCGATYIVLSLPTSDLESPRDPYASLNINFNKEIPEDDRRRSFDSLEKQILNEKDALGFDFLISEFNPKNLSARMMIYPPETNDLDTSINRLEANIVKFSQGLPPEVGRTVQVGYSYTQELSALKKFSVSFEAPSQVEFESIAIRLKESLNTIKGFVDFKLEKEERQRKHFLLTPRSEALSEFQVSPAEIAATISPYIGTQTVDHLKYNSLPVLFKLEIKPNEGSWSLDQILNLSLKKGANSIRLADLVHVIEGSSSRSISRKQQKSVVRTYVHYRESDPDVKSDILRKIKSWSFPSGTSPARSPSTRNIEEMQKQTNFVLVLSIFLIYLFLASMFESLFVPLSIIISVPLALVAGALGLWIFQLDLDVMARLGLVMLVGSSVNNSIILIDVIRDLRAQGYRIKEAIVIGCAKRLKAVAMTTTIQVISLLPVAFGNAKLMGIPYSSLGIVIIFGTLISTLIILVILPALYELADITERRISGFFSK